MDQNKPSLFPNLENDLRSFQTAGILPSQEIKKLILSGAIVSQTSVSESQIQPASMDLRLGPVAYRVRASFLPGEGLTVKNRLEQLCMHEIDLTRPAVLEKGCVYIVPLIEELALPSELSGKSNPKSTTGRLDVFTRLITDYGTEFERIRCGYSGKLYVEIVPRTFSILVHEGTQLNQIRFIQGKPLSSDENLTDLDKKEKLVYKENSPDQALISNGLWISIDLIGGEDSGIIGYRAKPHTPIIDFDQINYYDPLEFWEPIEKPKKGYIILNPDDFYILASKEKIRVPTDYAADMVAYDPSVGEFRIHYAGFFDPGFGYGKNEIKGTRAVLEVRSHEVPFLFNDGQVVGRLIYEKLLEIPEKIYGLNIGSSYQSQGISLGKQFKRF
ncbi:MAG: 2'-deoxycytidine 5'-triphosphate deaminase [Nitrospirae bacterium]|nr:2'-deoxycytidine 5'-triphosphate deaminase [Nitrospirota bacterium]